MNFETNKDPNYYKNNSSITNCGSFAFNICDWYEPDDIFDEDDYELAIKLIDEYKMSDIDILEILFDRDVEQIYKDFDVFAADVNYDPKDNEDLIAFRLCVNRSSCDGEIIVDYHFRVKRNDIWLEKCGSREVREVKDYNENPWVISKDLVYWGPIAYFVKKTN